MNLLTGQVHRSMECNGGPMRDCFLFRNKGRKQGCT
ncbi:hypothetical protein SpCBS45565_g05438 [Spizellomyces sp. 'palustris']|nr:hypothetical protein SpCBS45565_g05438 [Spizellomyces sp. 'palustris']